MSSLVSCTECTRHVRAAEVACPFCGASLEGGVARPAPSLPVNRALGRAAVVFMGATALVACGKTTASKDTAPSPTELAAPAYGPPPLSDSVPEGSGEGVPPLVKVDAGPRPVNAVPPPGLRQSRRRPRRRRRSCREGPTLGRGTESNPRASASHPVAPDPRRASGRRRSEATLPPAGRASRLRREIRAARRRMGGHAPVRPRVSPLRIARGPRASRRAVDGGVRRPRPTACGHRDARGRDHRRRAVPQGRLDHDHPRHQG